LGDEYGLPLTGAEFCGQLHYPSSQGRETARPRIRPESEILTSDADGRFRLDGLKPGLKSSISAHSQGRPVYRFDTGKVLHEIVIRQTGEVRDLGDVKVKVVRNQL
jgi:hypothetical protein